MIVLLVTGCGTVNMYHKLHRDGTFDFSIGVKSDNEMFLNTMKSAFEESALVEKATYIEKDDGFTYVLEKVTLEDVSDEEEEESVLETIGVKKEFKFPFYYYTFTLKNKGTGDSEFGSMGMALNYIVEPFGKITDTNGVFIGEDKKKVKFNLMKTKDYYITFRDFFLFSWIGGASKIIERDATENKIPIEEADTSDSRDDFGSIMGGGIGSLFEEEKEKTPPAKPTGKYYEQSHGGVTLTVTGYTFEKKSDTYGKLKDIDLTIYNEGSEMITPYLLINVKDKEEDELFTIKKEVDLGEWLDEGEYIQKKVTIDLGVGGANNPKDLGIHVTDLWGRIYSTVHLDTNLMEGFS